MIFKKSIAIDLSNLNHPSDLRHITQTFIYPAREVAAAMPIDPNGLIKIKLKTMFDTIDIIAAVTGVFVSFCANRTDDMILEMTNAGNPHAATFNTFAVF